jgi:hypothetical protein
MKAKSATVMLLYYEPGTHEEVTRWHEEIHRPEMHGTIPHIYHSEDWLSPVEYMALRPPTDLPRNGGEYLCLYWSQGTAQELFEGVRKYAAEVRERNAYHPHQEITWRDRMVVSAGQVRPGLEVTVDAVPLLHNTGLPLTISELAGSGGRQAYERWSEEVQVPRMLASGIFSGHYGLHSIEGGEQNAYVDIYFVERGDPIEKYRELQALEAGWQQDGAGSSGPQSGPKPIFRGLYRRIIPGQYDLFYT